jgi:hypothetical protein
MPPPWQSDLIFFKGTKQIFHPSRPHFLIIPPPAGRAVDIEFIGHKGLLFHQIPQPGAAGLHFPVSGFGFLEAKANPFSWSLQRGHQGPDSVEDHFELGKANIYNAVPVFKVTICDLKSSPASSLVDWKIKSLTGLFHPIGRFLFRQR